MRSIILGSAFALMATSAHAAFTITPATDGSGNDVTDTLPTPPPPSGADVYDPNFTANGGSALPDAWSQGDDVYVGVDDVQATGLGSIPIRLTYLGFEAGDTNTVGVLFDATGGGTSLTPIFATKDVTIDGTFIPGSASGETYVDGSVLNVGNFNSGDLVFRTFDSGTSGAFEDSPLTADNVALGFAGGTENGPQGDVLQIGLNDPFFDADADYDDMRLAAQVVPLPGAAVLFLSGLVGVGAATRRMRGRNGDGAATA